MPRRDARTFLSEIQLVTAQAVSTNSISKGIAQAQINTAMKPAFLKVVVIAALTDGGSNTSTTIDLVDDDNAALSSPATLASSILSFPQAAAAGTVRACMIPVVTSTQLYWGIQYTPNGANLTGGSFTAWVTNQRELQAYAPPSFTVASS